MNNIQNYGMANYQVNFQARGGKKTVKTLADLFQERQQNKTMLNRILNKIYNYMPKLECTCKYSGEDKNIHQGIIDIIR